MTKDIRIVTRVSAREKEHIKARAVRCGLSLSEFIRQRTLGYEPKSIAPEELFPLLEKIGRLQEVSASPDTDGMIRDVLAEITHVLLLPEREERKPWQSPDSGPSTNT